MCSAPHTGRIKPMTYSAADNRYESMPYRRIGRSGLKLPAISLGLWHNFGDDKRFEEQRDILRRAFDLGVNHFDLANNYGPPDGSAETNFGRHLRDDFKPYRDELVISTKAGYYMWPGPYGEWGSRKYLISSLDYAVRSGKALYAGISSYTPEQTLEAARILKELGTPLLIHQPSYSMLNRWTEDGSPNLYEVLDQVGAGSIAFSPLAQGMLTDRYLNGIPADSRAAQDKSLDENSITEEKLDRVRGLRKIAEGRGQSLAQMAIAWILRDQPKGSPVTSALVGASSVRQLEDTLSAINNLDFSGDELNAIDEFAVESDINLWKQDA